LEVSLIVHTGKIVAKILRRRIEKKIEDVLGRFGDFKIGGQIIHTLKYTDDLVLLAKEENVLEDMIDKLTEIGRCYGMEMKLKKKSNDNFKTTFPSKIIIDQKQLENVESFKYLSSILTNDGRCTWRN